MGEATDTRTQVHRDTPAATFTLPRYLLDWLAEEAERQGKKKSRIVMEALLMAQAASEDAEESERAA